MFRICTCETFWLPESCLCNQLASENIQNIFFTWSKTIFLRSDFRSPLPAWPKVCCIDRASAWMYLWVIFFCRLKVWSFSSFLLISLENVCNSVCGCVVLSNRFRHRTLSQANLFPGLPFFPFSYGLLCRIIISDQNLLAPYLNCISSTLFSSSWCWNSEYHSKNKSCFISCCSRWFRCLISTVLDRWTWLRQDLLCACNGFFLAFFWYAWNCWFESVAGIN